jgi:hypothetical protein
VFHAPGRRGERVALVRAGGIDALAEAEIDGRDGTVTFSTAGLRRGAHDVVLLDRHGTVLSRAPFWAYRPGEPPRVTTSRRVYTRGQPIDVSWSNAPGMRWDWLAIYRVRPAVETPYGTPGCNAGYCGNDGYLLYEYTKTAIEGTAAFSGTSATGDGTWPLRPGLYEVRLLLDDGYKSVAKSPRFRVVPR